MDDFTFSDLSAELIDQLIAVEAEPSSSDDASRAVALLGAAARADDAAAMPQNVKPAIVLCGGGSGLLVGASLRRLLDQFVAESGYSVAARQRAASVFVLGFDTWATPLLRSFGAGNGLVLPQNPLGVNARVQTLWRENAHFRAVWPERNGGPYEPDDFIDGAGGDRLKGHGAWLLGQFEGAQSVVTMVKAAIQQIQNVLGLAPIAADGTFEIPIYLVRGIGGGTGSGVGDAVAVELRHALPNDCRMIAVELLPDAAELKTQESEHPSLRANGAVALAEKERLQNGSHRLAPFFQRDGVAGTILAAESPFLYTYVFSTKNAKSLTMTVEGQLESLVAHCLATEIFLSAADQVQDPNSQFRQQLAALPKHDGRSCLYASGAVSELYYRPGLVAAALGGRFAAVAIAERLTLAAVRKTDAYALGRSAADAFMDEHRLSWKNRSLRVRLDTALSGASPLPPAPALAEGFPAWDDARVDDVPGVVAGRTKEFDAWRDRRWRPALAQRTAAALVDLRGATDRPAAGALVTAVEQLLAGDDGWGFARVAGFLDRLGERLAAEHDALMTEIDGPDWKREPGPGGLKERVAKRRAGSARALRDLQASFGLLGLRAAQAKRDFQSQWWAPFAGGERDLVRAQTALTLISALRAARGALASRLAELDGALGSGADSLKSSASDVLSARELGGVLEERVLEDEDLVVAAFAEEIRSSRVWVDTFVAQLLVGAGGVQTLIRTAATAQDPGRTVREGSQALFAHAAAAGAALFRPAVDALSVWDALHRELSCRLDQQKIDEPLRRALMSVRQDFHGLERPDGSQQRAALLLQTYAEQRLRICTNRAAPFWSLDANAPIEAPLPLQRPFPLLLVGYDKERYTAFCKNAGLADFLPRVVASLGVKPKDRPGPYAITVYAREGGVPLFYLDRELTGPMVRDAAIVGRARPLFTDARFASSLVEFDPPEPADARLRYAIAAAVHFRVATVDQAGAVKISLNGRGTPTFASAPQAWDALALDSALTESVIQVVNLCFASLAATARPQAVSAVASTAGAQAAAAASAGRQPERLWWEDAQRAAERRAQRGNYHIA